MEFPKVTQQRSQSDWKENGPSQSAQCWCMSGVSCRDLKLGPPEVNQVIRLNRNTNGCPFVLSLWTSNISALFLCWLVLFEACDSFPFYPGLAVQFELHGMNDI